MGQGGLISTHPGGPPNPDTLILSSRGENEEGPNHGRLTLVNADGSSYRIVQSAGSLAGAAPAPAPDGRTIAYDIALNGMLYHLDGESETFEPSKYGLPRGVQVVRIASPSWSPDGRRLAWIMAVVGGGYGSNGRWDIVLGVFDLEGMSVSLIHPYQAAGRGGWLPPATWSTDGEWLAYSVESRDEMERGLWLTSAIGAEQHRLSPIQQQYSSLEPFR